MALLQLMDFRARLVGRFSIMRLCHVINQMTGTLADGAGQTPIGILDQFLCDPALCYEFSACMTCA